MEKYFFLCLKLKDEAIIMRKHQDLAFWFNKQWWGEIKKLLKVIKNFI